jgi:hypothetical protein
MDARTLSLEDLIAKLFIARPDVKAYQAGPGRYVGQYFTHIQPGTRNNPVYLPWTRAAINEHLTGSQTFGHYLLSKDSKTKLFAFDIDLDQVAELPTIPMPIFKESGDPDEWLNSFQMNADARAAWLDRSHPARDFIKTSMRSLAHVIQRVIEDELKLPTAVAYTGAKGLHVYGFTGLMPAKEVREAAMLVIEALPIEAVRGKMMYKWNRQNQEGFAEHEIFTIEVFPKQDELSGEGGFGNLMRLPLGKNQKSNDPTFFVDTENATLGTLRPIDATEKLRSVLEGIS